MPNEGNNTSEFEKVEALRLILEREQCEPVSYAEASEIAVSLLDFFGILAEGNPTTDSQVAQPVQVELAGMG